MSDKNLRNNLVELLRGGHAHTTIEKALEGINNKNRNIIPEGMDHSVWEILEHMRIATWDILEFSRDAQHVSPKWPDGYWPKSPKPPNEKAWAKSVQAVNADIKAMSKLIAADSTDLYAPIPHGDGQTILREALLIANHNAYHLGELVLVRRLLGAWK